MAPHRQTILNDRDTRWFDVNVENISIGNTHVKCITPCVHVLNTSQYYSGKTCRY